MKKFLIFSILALTSGAVAAGGAFYYYLNVPVSKGTENKQVFLVRAGDNFIQIGQRLQREGLIRSSRFMRWYLKYSGSKQTPKRGEYELSAAMSLQEIIATIASGKSITYRFTVPEGKNMFEIAALLEADGFATEKEFIDAVTDVNFIRKLQIPTLRTVDIDSLEGYLYPDTYLLHKGLSAKEIAVVMVDRFKEVYSSIREKWKASKAVKELNLSDHEVIILASITEKETGAGFERPLISSVWYNRLKMPMRLQSDPTIIYGMWRRDGKFDGNIRRKDIMNRTEYNTYVINGLPKGPIANPGLNAIESVLEPAESDYLYFVSRNDGTHVFTKRYKDHQRAVNRLQKNPSARKGKSWRDLPEEKRAN